MEFQTQNRARVVRFPSTVVVMEKVGAARGWALAERGGMTCWSVRSDCREWRTLASEQPLHSVLS